MVMHLIEGCRICGNRQLGEVLSLGSVAMTGVFPQREDEDPASGTLTLVKCQATAQRDACGLLQLKEYYDPSEMYGAGYGYRSGITETMRRHLGAIVARMNGHVSLDSQDAVLDIGSNDGSLLKNYTHGGTVFGVDPSAEQFRGDYPENARLVADFFPSAAFSAQAPQQGFKVITSIAMFYDLHDPMSFMRAIKSHLAFGGVWYTEQSYVGALYEALCYDSVCHEHFSYYSLHQMQWMAQECGLKVVDVVFNDINGGSFGTLLCHADDQRRPNAAQVQKVLRNEEDSPAFSDAAIGQIQVRVDQHIETVRAFFAKEAGKTVIGYGASTKGNVLLQVAGLTSDAMPVIAERDPRKYGRVTPKTRIPIVSEQEARALSPDYFFVLPWHFKSEILQREQAFVAMGGKIVFPLPHFEVHGLDGQVSVE